MDDAEERRNREVELVHALSKTLSCGVDRQLIAICMELFEYGIDPESIADGMYKLSFIWNQFSFTCS